MGWSLLLLVVDWYFKWKDGLRERRRQYPSIVVPEWSPGHKHPAGFVPVHPSVTLHWLYLCCTAQSPQHHTTLHCYYTTGSLDIHHLTVTTPACSFFVCHLSPRKCLYRVRVSVWVRRTQFMVDGSLTKPVTPPSGTRLSVFCVFEWISLVCFNKCKMKVCLPLEFAWFSASVLIRIRAASGIGWRKSLQDWASDPLPWCILSAFWLCA